MIERDVLAPSAVQKIPEKARIGSADIAKVAWRAGLWYTEEVIMWCQSDTCNIPWLDKEGSLTMDILPSNAPHHKPKLPCYKCGEHPRHLNRPLCKACHSAWKSAYNKRIYNSDLQRGRHLRSKFHLTQYDYDLMFFQQGGCCAVCGKQETKIHPVTKKVWPLVVDHNHETGQIRALLCYNCNTLLGRVEQDRGLIKKLEKYLKKHGS